MTPLTNYFAHRTAAERYAESRPYIHPFIVDHIRALTGIENFGDVLDVGCGTGQSTRAVAQIARRVVGIDNSADMLAHSAPLPRVEYQRADAELLPFADSSFDLITVGLAFHWFDQPRFLREARRVLKPAGWLVVYNFGCTGEMQGPPDFRRWFVESYLRRYPTPPRAPQGVTDELASSCGLKLLNREVVKHGVSMSRDQFAEFLLTQSNVIVAVEEGAQQLDDVAAFLTTEMAPYFREQSATMEFRIEMVYLQPVNGASDRLSR